MTAHMDRGVVATYEDLTVVRWADPVVDPVGQPVTSLYVERFWLPILGPSCLVVLRRFTADLDHADEVRYRMVNLGAEVGLPGRGKARYGHSSPIVRTVSRLIDFRCAMLHGGCLHVRTILGPLSAHHVRRLPERLALKHTRLVHMDVASLSDRHDICACGHERYEHGGEDGDGCNVIEDARRINDELCRCEKFAGATS